MTALPGPRPAADAACRILHLEDSAFDSELIAAHLHRASLACTIRVVATREAYTAALAQGDFDLILADYNLPGFDGLTALSMARDTVPELPFIFVSGTLGEEAAVDAVKRGATDYVVKQRLTRLPVAIARAIGEMRARTGERDALAALRESEARLRLALDAGRLGSWELDLRTEALQASATCRVNFGRTADASFTYADLCEAILPEDRPIMQVAMAHSIAERADYDAEYRVVWPDGTLHWVQVRGRPIHAGDGTPLGMAGVSLDITERKLAEERQALLSREVDHRAKNALAVVQATLRLTKARDMPDYIRAVEGRVAALARAQTLLALDRWTGADLRALLAGELESFAGGDAARVTLEGPGVPLPARATQPLAMAIHELATNAVKYGALSSAEGRVDVCWDVLRAPGAPGLLRLHWAERGGPPLESPPKRLGFGRRVLDGTIRAQLGGTVATQWEPSGLVCDIEVPLEPSAAAQELEGLRL